MLATIFALIISSVSAATVAGSDAGYKIRFWHDFGAVAVNKQATTHWNFRAKKDLEIKAITLTGDAYQLVTDCPTHLPAQARCQVRAYFTPPHVGKHVGQLIVDLYTEAFIIDLKGEGID